MSDEKITINCGGGCCLITLLLSAATVVGVIVMARHLIAWLA